MKHSDRFLKIVDEARSRIREITPEEALERLESGENVLLIDVREESEWSEGHVDGAVHIGKGVIERDIEKYVEETDREIILYCGGGYRSALAADNLQEMGYTNVASMLEGWRGWNSREYPVQK
ncbi:MAG: rhodanese-like domain-containing protein [Candidatus Kapaibacterium sp.]